MEEPVQIVFETEDEADTASEQECATRQRCESMRERELEHIEQSKPECQETSAPPEHAHGPLAYITLIRHAQSRANVEHVLQGVADAPLSRTGTHQLKQLEEAWRSGETSANMYDLPKPSMVVSSPIGRACHTAHAVARGAGLRSATGQADHHTPPMAPPDDCQPQVVLDSGLCERNFGRAESTRKGVRVPGYTVPERVGRAESDSAFYKRAAREGGKWLTWAADLGRSGTAPHLLLAAGAALASSADTQDNADGLLPSDEQSKLQAVLLAAKVNQAAQHLIPRWNPGGTYAPTNVSCPEMVQADNYVGLIRNASDNKIVQSEQEWINKRHNVTHSRWADWLKQVGLDSNGGLPGGVDAYLSNKTQFPRVGIAISGGGYRAMLFGVGVLQGLDSRNGTAKQRGTGGFLQLADYVAGLSGGSWATGSKAINDWPTTQEMIEYVYDLESDLIWPSDGKISFYTDLLDDVDDKDDAGFPVGITDYWGRALSYHLLNQTKYPKQGQTAVWSDIVNTTSFQEATYPFPVIISIGRQPDARWINLNATYFEFTPYEFGSWQPNLQAFMPVGSLGSALNNGQPSAEDKSCVAGYENFGWTVGTSSTLFNALYLKTLQGNTDSILNNIVKSITGKLSDSNNDVAQVPNPFLGYRPETNRFNNMTYLDLVDGGEANHNVPLEPLFQPARKLDMVLAVDSSADTDSGWPNGTALYETFRRAQLKSFGYMPFPKIPDANTFINKGLNTRPSFFGCSINDTINGETAANNAVSPLLVYLPNYPYSFNTNTDTYELSYSKETQQKFVDNSVNVATMGGEMEDWSQCLACASLLRSLQRSGQDMPDKCQSCFNRYCWDGQSDSNAPASKYQPSIGTPPFVASNGTNSVQPASTGVDSPTKGDSGDSGAASIRIASTTVAAVVVAAIMAVVL
ncbi:lysophospholipase [Malassezia cuniculi]|uniref:Lysophospholipase n=1 Tax=Malassezia cuniculi TaxID=948313 RepID=A0AAF0J4G6_9BASI|nr:lysophospholipase [Malassezia cuniculi]